MDTNNQSLAVSKINQQISEQLMIESGDVGTIESYTPTSITIFFIRIWQSVELAISDIEIFDVTQTGDAFEFKICNVCHKLQPTSKFERNQNGVGNRPVRRPSCMDCRRILNGMPIISHDRTAWANNKPSYVPFECPICKKRTIAGVTCKVVLDHNHQTGVPRAWICDSCNTGIGRFKDDTAILQRAIEFLQSD